MIGPGGNRDVLAPKPRAKTVNDIANSSRKADNKLRVQSLDLLRVAVDDPPPTALHRGGQLARLHRPLGGQQGKPADPLPPCQVRVRLFDTGFDLREDGG